jgi:hypothetical protein
MKNHLKQHVPPGLNQPSPIFAFPVIFNSFPVIEKPFPVIEKTLPCSAQNLSLLFDNRENGIQPADKKRNILQQNAQNRKSFPVIAP